MKRACALLVLFSTLFVSQLFAGQINDEWTVFSEKKFSCITGTSKTYTQTFTTLIARPQSFNLKIVNGNADGSRRVSNATIKLNGVTVVTPSECNFETASLTKEVTIKSSNTLQVTVNGTTGSFLTIECSKHIFSIQPIVECVENNGNGTYTAHFGYSNSNSFPVTVPVGLLNLFLPLPINRNQPTVFEPGLQQNVFTVVFNGNPLIWEVRGRIATATNNPALACSSATDTTCPNLTITAPINGLITSAASVQVIGTASDASPVTVTINGTAVTVDASGGFSGTVNLAEGSNTIMIVARDASGNQTTVTRTVSRDTQAPIVNLASPSDSLVTNQQTINVSGTVIDSTAIQLTVNGNSVTIGAGGAFSTQIALTEGINTITIVATDAAGNQTTIIRTVTRDTESPVITLISPIDSLITNQSNVTLSGTIANPSGITLTVNGNPTTIETDGTFSTSVGLNEGLNAIILVATDPANNQTTITRTIRRDTQSPVVTLTSPIDSLITNQLNVTVSGTVVDSTAIQLTVNSELLTVGANGVFSKLLTLVEGMNTVTIAATDAAANQTTVIRHVSVRSIPPELNIIGLIDSTITKDTTITIQGKVSGQFPIILTVNGLPVSIGSDSTFSFQLNLQEGINTISIIATDAAGNVTTVNRIIWRDTQTPQLTITSFEDGMVTNQSTLIVQGSVSDLTLVTLTINGIPVTINPDGTFSHQLTLVEGKNTITLVATDDMENHLELTRTVRLDTNAPVLSIISLNNNTITADSIIAVMGSTGDSTNMTLTINGVAQTLSADGAFSTNVLLSYGSNTITFIANDQIDNTTTIVKTVTRTALPPDPVVTAPPLDMTVGTLVMDATEFIYSGADPIQKEVVPGTINKLHVTVLKGRVLDGNLQPLSGVEIAILGKPEFGYTFTREDGQYDMAVNGGGEVQVNFSKPGYLPVQRQVTTRYTSYANVDEVALLPIDTAVHLVDFTQPEIVQGTPASDVLGTRKPALFFEQGTHANLVLTKYNYKIIRGCYSSRYFPNNRILDNIILIPTDSLVSLSSVNVRTKEYTVGPNAELLIPATLPQTVAYTFAAELTADEMLATGAKDVRFDQPVSLYLENVMNFPVGLTVPMGCLNKQTGLWETSDNGRVIKILDTTGGIAAIDYDGDNAAEPQDTLVVRGLSVIEQQYIASVYSPGQSIWRAEITHLGTYAGGFSMIAPNAKDPQNPLPDRYAKVDRDNIMAGSVIGVQNQTLGESIPITNTSMTMHYKSDRVFGRREAYCIDIPVTGNTIPDSMSEVSLSIYILGRQYDTTFVPQPDITYHFEWDGKDAYGRRVQGQQNILTEISYCYPAQYALPPDFKKSFATPSGQVMMQYVTARKLMKRTQVWEGKIGAFDIVSLGIGGWSLSLHHGYDCVGRIVYKGDGSVRSANVMDNVINTIAGRSTGNNANGCTPNFEGVPAVTSLIPFGTINRMQFGQDGLLYFIQGSRITKIDAAGMMSTFAGLEGPCSNGLTDTSNGIMANCADIYSTDGFAQGPDGSWYVSEIFAGTIWKISPEGEWTHFAGVKYDAGPLGNSGIFSGDGGPALEAHFARPYQLAFGKDGCLYIGDTKNYRIRKISPDGTVTTVAGTGVSGFSGDGGPAIAARIHEVRGLDIGPDGSIYFGDYVNRRVRKITPDGIIRTFAGNGSGGNTGDGGPALYARINVVDDITIAKDGTVFFNSGEKVRAVATDSYIKTIVGGGETYWLDNAPATSIAVGWYPRVRIGPDNNLYVGELPSGYATANSRIFRVTPPLPGITLSEILVASEDGSERYVFTYSGRHLRTLDALTGVTKYTFGYNSRYKLVSITDIDSLVTRIERDSSDNALAIISPYGVRTNIVVDSLGYLVQATNPADESNQFTVTSGGLMTSKTDPRGNTYHFEYDTLGYLTRDADPVDPVTGLGGYTNLTRVYDSLGYTVTATTAMGKVTKYRAEKSHDGTRRFINTDPNGLKTITVDSTDGSSYTITPEGMNTPIKEKADPRFGMQSPLVNATAKTPGGIQSNVNQFRTITQMTGTAVTGLQDSILVNEKSFKTNYDGNARVLTKTSAEGRKTFSFFDEKGRIVKDSIPGLLAMSYKFDSKGRKIEDNQGGRKTSYEYDSLGRQSIVTDPYGRSTWFYYDAGDRLIKTILPDLSEVAFTYDHNGNLLSLTPPSRQTDGGQAKPEHTFDYSNVDLETRYTPPFAGDSARATARIYTFDKEPWKILRPDSLNIAMEYGGRGSLAGLPKKIYFDRGMLNNICDTLKGQQIGVVSAEGDTLKFVYDGSLVKQVSWSGTNETNTVKGNVAFRYNSDQQVITETVKPATGSADSVNLQYDKDGLLTSVGLMKLKYGTSNTLLQSDTVGNIITNYGYDMFGALSFKESKYGATTLYRVDYMRDSLNRIMEKTENVQGNLTKLNYSYDVIGRLIQVKRNDTLTAEYQYDANGNRLAKITPIDTLMGVYDTQDRLLSYSSTQLLNGSSAKYFYTQNGDLTMKVDIVTSDTTRYSYDAFGALRNVTQSDGTLIEYLIDASGKRVGRKVNGVVTQKWLYSSDLRIIAELDSANNITSRFVYTTSENVPEYFVKSDTTYRIITDHLGSVRQVVNTATGAIIQKIDYDEYGNVFFDSKPGFTPFGYVGGLYDTQTKLVRFGARDYDASIGRWTIKDPILFRSEETDFYVYCSNDPANITDPNGQVSTMWVKALTYGITGALNEGFAAWYQGRNVAISMTIGFISGFIGGGVSDLTGGHLGYATIISVVGNFITQEITSERGLNSASLVFSGICGFTRAALGNVLNDDLAVGAMAATVIVAVEQTLLAQLLFNMTRR